MFALAGRRPEGTSRSLSHDVAAAGAARAPVAILRPPTQSCVKRACYPLLAACPFGSSSLFRSPFQQYCSAALYGEKLLDDEAERSIATWTSPTAIARLLLMLRIPRPIPRGHDLWRFRVLGAIIPDPDRVVATEQENLPTPAKPILPVHMRPALLAGIAIVERAGPEMLRMLRGHMIGENKVRFTDAAESMIAKARRRKALPQMFLT